ncbi:MAG: hypothetical protein HGA59_00985 [Chlorobiaceae bacterium]|nr:hypothetical protein [Chlorobiaceae bacterium]NTV16644.1 hypothetical protein [Chlorobiaceae bacterium]
MAEETKNSGQRQGDIVKGDLSTILVSVGNLIDSTIEPVSKIVVQALDSLVVVAKQILEGVNSTLGSKK